MAGAWPDELELEVNGIAQGGDGVGRWEGRAVFASGALPGERVWVRIDDRQRSFARGHVVDVLAAAPERITSPCPREGECGAAGWRWIDYDAQLGFKAEILRDQLRHLGGIEVEVAAVHGMEPPHRPHGPACAAGAGWSYRTTAELHVAGGIIGYFAPHSRRVVDVPQCCLHHPLVDEALAALHPLLDSELPLETVTLRCAPANGSVLAVVAGSAALDDLARRWMRDCPNLVGIVQRQRRALRLLAGQDYLIHELDGIRWHVSAGSFFQVNDRQTAKLIRRVEELIAVRPGERVLDLYCGVGTFALPLARAGAHVTGVEVYPPAVEDARRSAEANGLTALDWHTGPVEQALAKLSGAFDGAVLDPPRRGCEPETLRHLARLRPRRIVYVACHPGTLARDCKLLRDEGYDVERAEVIDLFPHTHHVEGIVLLSSQ
jgi:23S rRNA (uracil1939-C5)-methyltransferase